MSQPFTKVVSKRNKKHIIDAAKKVDAEKLIEEAVMLKLEECVFNYLALALAIPPNFRILVVQFFSGNLVCQSCIVSMQQRGIRNLPNFKSIDGTGGRFSGLFGGEN